MSKKEVTQGQAAGHLAIRGGVGRISIRSYFSSHLLAAAAKMARTAEEIEDQHGDSRSAFSLDHRGQVLGSILCGVGFLEAMVNELYQDAFDSHAPRGGAGIHPLTSSTSALMAEYWRATESGAKGRALDKYQALLRFAGQPPLDEGAQPYQDAYLAVRLRNAIAHYRPEFMSDADPAHLFEKGLRTKFPDNKMFAGSGNAWWPDHCLGTGCANWVIESAVALTDQVAAAVGITTNYGVLRERGELGSLPGAPRSIEGQA